MSDLKTLRSLAKKTKHIHGMGYSKMNKSQLTSLLKGIIKDDNEIDHLAGFKPKQKPNFSFGPGEKHVLVGEGIVGDTIKKIKDTLFFSPDRLPGDSQKIFNQYKDKHITKIIVKRAPLASYITKMANFVSRGAFDKKLASMGYDKSYHLYSIVEFSDAAPIIIEKNQRINLDTNIPKEKPNTESVEVRVPGVTLDTLLETTRKMLGDHDFYQYSIDNNNCQKFIYSILKANGLNNPVIDKFILQDAKELTSSLPGWAVGAFQGATDLAGKIQQVVTGQGRKKKTKKVIGGKRKAKAKTKK